MRLDTVELGHDWSSSMAAQAGCGKSHDPLGHGKVLQNMVGHGQDGRIGTGARILRSPDGHGTAGSDMTFA